MKNLLSLIFIFGILISCKTSKKNIFDVLNELESKLDKKYIKELLEKPVDSVVFVTRKFSIDFLQLYNDSLNKTVVLEFMKENDIDENINPALFLSYAFYFKKHHNKLNAKMIAKEVERYKNNELQKSLNEAKLCNDKRMNIAEKNFKEINKNESLYLKFPVSIGGNSTNAIYYSCPGEAYYSTGDSLFVKGILIDKYFKRNNDSIISDIIFKIKIIEFSKKNVLILGNKYNVGDLFDLHLISYGRPISTLPFR
jgi:hypothetical protein